MGIDRTVLRFLQFAHRRKAFGDVATLGRQGVHLSSHTLSEMLGAPPSSHSGGSYCEELLEHHFDASTVESFDNSSFEGATHIVDLNKPLVGHRHYDTVFDGGCLEHIFDIAEGLKNTSLLCRPGGQILHVLPSNNFCGHGFWQFSPELFFSLYSKTNGYRETEVFLADLVDDRTWFKVKPPQNGVRVNVVSSVPLYVLCRTVRESDVSHKSVQQSDYVYAWNAATENQPHTVSPKALRERMRNTVFYKFVRSAYAPFRPLMNRRVGLSAKNPGLEPVSVASLVSKVPRGL